MMSMVKRINDRFIIGFDLFSMMFGFHWVNSAYTVFHFGPVSFGVNHRMRDSYFHNHLLWRTRTNTWRVYMMENPHTCMFGIRYSGEMRGVEGPLYAGYAYLGFLSVTATHSPHATAERYTPTWGLLNWTRSP